MEDWDLGIDWDSLLPAGTGGPTYEGGTLDPFEINETTGGGGSDPFAWNGTQDTFDWNAISDMNSWIGDPLDDINGVYIPDTAVPPSATNTTPRPPTTTTPRPPASTPPATSTRPATSSSSGNSAADLAKLVNSILQAIKPATPVNATGGQVTTPAPVSSGFDIGSMGMLLIGAGAAYLILRKR